MKVRQAAWAGQFYPDSPEQLKQMINSYLKMAEPMELGNPIVGLVSPHAGYVYSGRTAAVGYKQVEGRSVETVVVLAPSHGTFIEGVSIYDGDLYRTPLGDVPIDKSRSREIAEAASTIHLGESGHSADGDRAEHALEVQLPFLQMVLSSFKLVAGVFHDYSWENCRSLGEAIADVCDPQSTLIVASSDLYHGESYDDCLRTDTDTLNSLEQDTPIQFCFNANHHKIMACGAGPIAALKTAGEQWGASAPRVISRTNSADVMGKHNGYVVGYAAAVMTL